MPTAKTRIFHKKNTFFDGDAPDILYNVPNISIHIRGVYTWHYWKTAF